jgi:hypothetical protein
MKKIYRLPLLISLLSIAAVKAELYDAVLLNYIKNETQHLLHAEIHSINTAAHNAVRLYKLNPNATTQLAQRLTKDKHDNWDYLALRRYDEKKKLWYEFPRVYPTGNNNDISVIIHPNFSITKGSTEKIIPHDHMH